LGIALLGASTGLSSSDLVTQPNWTQLASYTTNSANAAFSINNIPQTYKTLKIMCPRFYQPASVTGMQVRLNGSTSSIYNYLFLQTNNTGGLYSDPSVSPRNDIRFSVSYNSYNHGFILTIENYSSSTEYKLFKGWSGAEGNYAGEVEGYFASTSPITSIDFYADSSTVNVNPSGGAGRGLFIWGSK